jgi:DNA-binding response OmpR family regulator
VLLDLNLPEISGYDVCRTIKRSPEFGSIHIILLSASSEHIVEKANEIGADDYVVKPYDIKFLLEKIEKVYRRDKQ